MVSATISLVMTDGQIADTDKQIAYERNVGIIPDPNAQMGAEGAPLRKVVLLKKVLQHRRSNLPPPEADLNGDGVVSQDEA